MFSPAYTQLLNRKGLNFAKPNITPIITPLSQTAPSQQTPIREQGYGTHFKDTPPPFIQEKKDNKIERLKKPEPKKKKKKKKTK